MKITKWSECPIDVFYELYDVVADKDTNIMQKNVKIISIIYEIPEDQVYAMSMEDYNKHMNELEWVTTTPPFNANFSTKSISIDGTKYTVTPLDKLSIGQYIDFQTFWQKKDEQKYIGNILASFLVPKGHKYGEGYDILELANTLRTKLDIVTARNLMFFFLKKYLDLMVSSFIYLRRKMKTKEEKSQTTQALNTILDGLV